MILTKPAGGNHHQQQSGDPAGGVCQRCQAVGIADAHMAHQHTASDLRGKHGKHQNDRRRFPSACRPVLTCFCLFSKICCNNGSDKHNNDRAYDNQCYASGGHTRKQSASLLCVDLLVFLPIYRHRCASLLCAIVFIHACIINSG